MEQLHTQELELNQLLQVHIITLLLIQKDVLLQLAVLYLNQQQFLQAILQQQFYVMAEHHLLRYLQRAEHLRTQELEPTLQCPQELTTII